MLHRLSIGCVLALLLIASGLPASADERPAPLTSFEAGPMRLANLIVAGETVTVRTQRQQQIATVRVLDVLRGKPPSKPITVFVRGPHPAANLRDPVTTTFPREGTARHVFFLRTREKGIACDFRDAFEADGVVGDAKIAALKQEIRLAEIPNAQTRAKETLTYLLGSLVSKRRWTSAHATRELLRFAKARRDLIDGELERQLEARQRRPLPKAERAELAKLVRYLRENPRNATNEPAPRVPVVRDSSPWRAAFRKASTAKRKRMLEESLADPRGEELKNAWWAYRVASPEERRLIVRRVSDLDDTSVWPTLRGLYAAEEDRDVRLEIIRAGGLLGSSRDVAWLAERALSRPLERSALLALARIRTDVALRALRDARARIDALTDAGKALRLKWVDYLLSELFEQSELMR